MESGKLGAHKRPVPDLTKGMVVPAKQHYDPKTPPGGHIPSLPCAECGQPIAWFDAGNTPMSGWIHTDLAGGDWSHRAQPPASLEGDHKTAPVRVWVDVDEGVAGIVASLNQQSGVRTYASCEGTAGQKPAYIMVGWLSDEAFLWLTDHYVLTEISRENRWAYLHPFAKLVEQRPERPPCPGCGNLNRNQHYAGCQR